MKKPDYCVVIGGANVDIGGRPDTELIQKDSNPGKIFTSMGGVGRNIAHNLRLLGVEVKFITAVGNDTNGHMIIDSCHNLGMDVSAIHMSAKYSTSTYLFIADKDGDMSVAVSDMSITESITPALIKSHLDMINKAKLVIVDANIPEDTISYIAENVTVPLFAEPVSCTKAARLSKSLEKFTAIKPNRLEIRGLIGMDASTDEGLKQSVKTLFDKGVKQVFISLGADGLYVASPEEEYHIPSLPCELKNATGAGDALMAGLAYGFMNDRGLKDTAMIALASAAISLEGASTINSRLSANAALKRAGLA